MLSNTKAFTLVDLLGCIAIIAILATLAFPSIKGAIQASKDSSQVQQVQVLNFALEQARVRKDNPILYSGTKYQVYDYLVAEGFLIAP